ncbi:uncharacterized protein LOC116944343 [Petromyzon marinus]|uniref:Uncharacterized protein LOC116944343 n=1 Tax=Petromyzon marinus TaxID=7757 RepID=A0AAJ7TBA1_PETMA|nr:uncharacterized protein LOC116944343 [Petromyzon marinus]
MPLSRLTRDTAWTNRDAMPRSSRKLTSSERDPPARRGLPTHRDLPSSHRDPPRDLSTYRDLPSSRRDLPTRLDLPTLQSHDRSLSPRPRYRDGHDRHDDRGGNSNPLCSTSTADILGLRRPPRQRDAGRMPRPDSGRSRERRRLPHGVLSRRRPFSDGDDDRDVSRPSAAAATTPVAPPKEDGARSRPGHPGEGGGRPSRNPQRVHDVMELIRRRRDRHEELKTLQGDPGPDSSSSFLAAWAAPNNTVAGLLRRSHRRARSSGGGAEPFLSDDSEADDDPRPRGRRDGGTAAAALRRRARSVAAGGGRDARRQQSPDGDGDALLEELRRNRFGVACDDDAAGRERPTREPRGREGASPRCGERPCARSRGRALGDESQLGRGPCRRTAGPVEDDGTDNGKDGGERAGEGRPRRRRSSHGPEPRRAPSTAAAAAGPAAGVASRSVAVATHRDGDGLPKSRPPARNNDEEEEEEVEATRSQFKRLLSEQPGATGTRVTVATGGGVGNESSEYSSSVFYNEAYVFGHAYDPPRHQHCGAPDSVPLASPLVPRGQRPPGANTKAAAAALDESAGGDEEEGRGAASLCLGLVSVGGRYLSCEASDSAVVTAPRGTGPEQRWRLDAVRAEEAGGSGGASLALLRSEARGGYARVDERGRLACDAAQRRAGTVLAVEAVGARGAWRLRAVARERYLAAGGPRGEVTCDGLANQSVTTWWPHVELHPHVWLWSRAWGSYVRAEMPGAASRGAQLYADAAVPHSPGCVFTVHFSSGRYHVETDTGVCVTCGAVPCSTMATDGVASAVHVTHGVLALRDTQGRLLYPQGPRLLVSAGSSQAIRDALLEPRRAGAVVSLWTHRGHVVTIAHGEELYARGNKVEPQSLFHLRVDGDVAHLSSVQGLHVMQVEGGNVVVRDGDGDCGFTVTWRGPCVLLRAPSGLYVTMRPIGQIVASATLPSPQELFTVRLENRPRLILQGPRGFVGPQGGGEGEGTLRCDQADFTAFQLLPCGDGAYHLITGEGGQGGWVVRGEDAAVVLGGPSPPSPFLVQLHAPHRLCLVAPGGALVKGAAHGELSATGEKPDIESMWEF